MPLDSFFASTLWDLTIYKKSTTNMDINNWHRHREKKRQCHKSSNEPKPDLAQVHTALSNKNGACRLWVI